MQTLVVTNKGTNIEDSFTNKVIALVGERPAKVEGDSRYFFPLGHLYLNGIFREPEAKALAGMVGQVLGGQAVVEIIDLETKQPAVQIPQKPAAQPNKGEE